jgi:hypothetical protein
MVVHSHHHPLEVGFGVVTPVSAPLGYFYVALDLMRLFRLGSGGVEIA